MRHQLFMITLVTWASACLGLFSPAWGNTGEQWKLLNEDAAGNRLYLDEASLELFPETQVQRVTIRFELRKSETKMFFVDEVDCRQARIKRLSLRMLNPVCTGDSETYAATFEGGWDVVSEGIEQRLFEAICH